MMIESFTTEYRRYRAIGEKAMAQLSEEDLNRLPMAEGNSIAMLVRHISGNFLSRFSDFLTSDGEKPWRDRDAEFEIRGYDREEIDRLWRSGWEVLEAQLAALADTDGTREVRIRSQPLSVHEALSRSLAHVAYHVGQIVLLARMVRQEEWAWISIPRGESQAYNSNPTLEKGLK